MIDIDETNPAPPGVVFRTISAAELRRMDDAARKRELEAFERDRSIRMPFSGFSKRVTVDW
jgi:hypothetical protein